MKYGSIFVRKSAEEVFDYSLLVGNLEKALLDFGAKEEIRVKLIKSQKEIISEGDVLKLHLKDLSRNTPVIDFEVIIERVDYPVLLSGSYQLYESNNRSLKEGAARDYLGDFGIVNFNYRVTPADGGCYISSEISHSVKPLLLRFVFWVILVAGYFKNKKYLKYWADLIEAET